MAELAAAWIEEDLGDAGAPARIVAAAERAVGPLTALVCCHAHSEVGGLFDATGAQVDRHLAVNARGTLMLIAEFAQRFGGEPGAGRIVTFSSGLPLAGEIAYAASKGALEWLTVSAAAELAPRGICVNAIDPGPTETGCSDEAASRSNRPIVRPLVRPRVAQRTRNDQAVAAAVPPVSANATTVWKPRRSGGVAP